MNSTELRDLLEAYSEVYTPEEYVDEGETGRGPRLIDAYDKPPYSDDKDSAKNPIKLKRKLPKMKGVVRKEETDFFDTILEYLVAEGYADTNKAAIAIMANMSEEWKQSIVEQNAIVTTGTSTNAAGEKIPFTHRVEPSGKRTVEDKFGKRELRQPRPKVKSKRRASGDTRNEEYVDEAQRARENPGDHDKEERRKYEPVRGERTPMPPRGDKRREDFEKWYAANVR